MILAIASGGGHFVQLRKILSQFESSEVIYYSTIDKPVFDKKNNYEKIPDCNLKSMLSLLHCFIILLYKILKLRPTVIITTGAAPGFLALLIGKLVGSNTIWIDSIANAEELSLAGSKAKWVADHWLTQWPELARPDGPKYLGSIL